METAALCKPIQRFADLLRIPGTWVLTGLGQLLAALGSFPHFPQPLRLLHTHLYWRFLECQSIEVTLTQNGHLTHHEIPSVASLRPGGHFPRIGWPVSPEYAAGFRGSLWSSSHGGVRKHRVLTHHRGQCPGLSGTGFLSTRIPPWICGFTSPWSGHQDGPSRHL